MDPIARVAKIKWHKTPLRKPLAAYTALLIGLVVLASVLLGKEVTEAVSDLLRWLGVTTIGGYYATSTYEATKK